MECHCYKYILSGPSEGKMKCYGLVDGRSGPQRGCLAWDPGVLPRIFFFKLEAKTLLLGTLHSIPSSAKLLSQQASQH